MLRRGGAPWVGGASFRPPIGVPSCLYTVRSRATSQLTQWTAAGYCPGSGATMPRAALATAQAVTPWAWERKVRYPCISPREKARAVLIGKDGLGQAMLFYTIYQEFRFGLLVRSMVIHLGPLSSVGGALLVVRWVWILTE